MRKFRDFLTGWRWKTVIPDTEPPENWHEDFIVHLVAVLRPNTYVELGLYQCEVFNRAIPYAERLVGVDIDRKAGEFMERSSGKTTFFHGTTTAFAQKLKKKPMSIDLLFIDADHSKEAVAADFKNFFPFIADQGLIVIHDSYPRNQEFIDPKYCGDGYQTIARLSRSTKDYEMVTIPMHPGLTIIRKRKHHLPW
jgi:predicted O-methyltransferase YrrM